MLDFLARSQKLTTSAWPLLVLCGGQASGSVVAWQWKSRRWKTPVKCLLMMTRWFRATQQLIVWGCMWGLSAFTFTFTSVSSFVTHQPVCLHWYSFSRWLNHRIKMCMFLVCFSFCSLELPVSIFHGHRLISFFSLIFLICHLLVFFCLFFFAVRSLLQFCCWSSLDHIIFHLLLLSVVSVARVEVNISLAFLHWVGIALHPWPFVSDIAIFVLKGDVKHQLTSVVLMSVSLSRLLIFSNFVLKSPHVTNTGCTEMFAISASLICVAVCNSLLQSKCVQTLMLIWQFRFVLTCL